MSYIKRIQRYRLKISKLRPLLLTDNSSEKKNLNNVIVYRKKVQVPYAYHNYMIDLFRYTYSKFKIYLIPYIHIILLNNLNKNLQLTIYKKY